MHKGVEINQLNGFTEILEAIKSIYSNKMRKPTVDEVEAQYKADRDVIEVILDGWWRELTNGW